MTNAPLFSYYNKAEDQYSAPVSTMMHDGLTDAFSSKPMGLTVETIAERYGITRKEQDEFAYHSQMKAAKSASSKEI